MNVPMFRNVTMKCLTEIAGVNVSQYEQQFVVLFTLAMTQLKQVGSNITDIMYRDRVEPFSTVAGIHR